MAYISRITDLKINGNDYYEGSGPVILTWTEPDYSADLAGKLYIDIEIEDGGRWGPDGTPIIMAGPTSYTLTQADIDHIVSNGGFATISIQYFGYVTDFESAVSEDSNVVSFAYSEQKNDPVVCFAKNAEWKKCILHFGINKRWVKCEAHYGINNKWMKAGG